MIRVAVDAMGGDNAPAEIIKGAAEAVRTRKDIQVILVGKEDVIGEHLKNYSEIHLFLDNDQAGKVCKNEILKTFPKANDCSEIYSEHKDLNEFLIERIKKESEILRQKEQNEQQQNVPDSNER